MSLNRETPQGAWSSRWTFVAAATGLAIGLGNFWRLPYIAGEHGGGLFLLLYLGFLLTVAAPVVVAEVVMGSRGRASPVLSVRHLAQESGTSHWWQGFAVLASIGGLLILASLCVVGGWVLAYIPLLAQETLTAASVELAAEHFNVLLASPERMQYWHGLFVVLVGCLVSLRMTRGLGRILRLAVPLLLIMLAVAVYCGYALGDINAALHFLFEPRAQDVDAWSVLIALSQAFLTLGLGMGAMMICGAYFPDGRSISRQVAAVVLLDSLVAVMAGVAVYALVLDHNIIPGRGVALLFVSLPYAFGNMLLGDIAGALFFGMLALVVVTTAVALLEPAVAWLSEITGWHLVWVAAALAALVWLLGQVYIYALTDGADLLWGQYALADYLELVSAQILVPFSAFGLVLFAGWRLRVEVLRDELHNTSALFFWLWRLLLRYIAPAAILVILVGGVYQRLLQ